MTRDKDSNKQDRPAIASNENDDGSFDSMGEDEIIGALILFLPTTVTPLFALGHIVATRGALELLDRLGIDGGVYLTRHQRGDWGTVCADDAAENGRAVADGNRILSEYRLGAGRERLWIITEWDRSVTTLLMPEEY
jgi:hypothetical protein